MCIRDSGKVICIGSGAGVEGQDGLAAYGAIKEATRAMARTAAREWGKYLSLIHIFFVFPIFSGRCIFAAAIFIVYLNYNLHIF